MTPNINIIDLAEKHGQTSYRNRADTKHPAYGFTEEGLQAFAHALLAAAPQAEQATEEMRVCNSEECGWIGPLSETYGYKHSPATLCPECKETTELSAPAHPAEGVPAPEMNEDGYLPCPFCGSHRVSLSTGQTGDGTPWHYVECESCAGTAEPEKWNERATQPAAQGLDAKRLDFIENNSVSLEPEWEGPWTAMVYREHESPSVIVDGKTPRQAIDAAMAALAAQAKQGEQANG